LRFPPPLIFDYRLVYNTALHEFIWIEWKGLLGWWRRRNDGDPVFLSRGDIQK
jgi:hypothetical protein